MAESLFELSAQTNTHEDFSFAALRGKAVLVVNTASQCGFTPQYQGLEALYTKYRQRGFEIVAFPCDQFGHQEPGSDEEIATFCQKNYGVTFALMSKTKVNGADAHPVFVFLKERAPGLLVSSVKWNFTKFLIAPDGTTVERFAPNTPPERLSQSIEKFLPR